MKRQRQWGQWHWLLLLLLVSGLIIASSGARASAQSPNSIDLTLEDMGYEDRILIGPESVVRFYFGLPAHWELKPDSYIQLNVDYRVGTPDDYPVSTLSVTLNSVLLHTENLTSPDAFALQIQIPQEAINRFEDQAIQTLELEFEVPQECLDAILKSLLVKNTSFVHLAHDEKPLSLDLAAYPAPFYQAHDLEPVPIRFVLPDHPSQADLRAAAMIAARLGQLSSTQLPMVVTLASELGPNTTFEEHLIVIGQPEDQPLLQELDLPERIVERQLSLTSEVPDSVVSGETTSYSLVVENTSPDTHLLIVNDRLPVGAELLQCSELCETLEPGLVQWNIGALAPGERASITLSIQVDEDLSALNSQDVALPSATRLTHTATLFNDQGDILNVDTRSMQLYIDSDAADATGEAPEASADAEASDYFFAINGLALSPEYGLVQITLSPWKPNRAILVVTGLSDAAMLHAAQALSIDNRSPGMWGEYAIVQATRPLEDVSSFLSGDVSLADLGHANETITLTVANLDINFIIPPGRDLDQNAYLALHYSHGPALSKLGATMQISLNGVSIGSVYFDETTLYDQWVQFPLPPVVAQWGNNRIRLHVSAGSEHVCQYYMNDRYWVTVFNDSLLHFQYHVADRRLDLSQYPYPLNAEPTLQDVAFVVSPNPTVTEITGVVTLAAQLGSASGGVNFAPQVVLGDSAEMDSWAEYHLIVIGLPTENPYLATINDALPQRFQPGTNHVLQELDFSIYQLPPEMSLGYVQALPSALDATRTALVITGTTDEGVGWALNALIDRDLQARFAGNLVLIRDREIRSIDTRSAADEEADTSQEVNPSIQDTAAVTVVGETILAPTADVATPWATLTTVTATVTPAPTVTAAAALFSPTVVPTATPGTTPDLIISSLGMESASDAYEHPKWLVSLMGVSALVVVVSVGIAVIQARE